MITKLVHFQDDGIVTIRTEYKEVFFRDAEEFEIFTGLKPPSGLGDIYYEPQKKQHLYNDGINTVERKIPDEFCESLLENITTYAERKSDVFFGKTADEIKDIKRKIAVSYVTEHIQHEVNKYNVLNDVDFASVHNCESYIRSLTYEHQPFCKAVWDWSVTVWEAIRAAQKSSTPPESLADVDSVLPKFNFS